MALGRRLSLRSESIEADAAKECDDERWQTSKQWPRNKGEQSQPQSRRISPMRADRTERGNTECADGDGECDARGDAHAPAVAATLDGEMDAEYDETEQPRREARPLARSGGGYRGGEH